jgi:hypothetical protein
MAGELIRTAIDIAAGEPKKNGNGNGKRWQLIRDVLLSGTFLFCLGILWQTSSFVTKVDDFMAQQKDEWIKIDVRVKLAESDLQILKEWKVARTQQPFNDSKQKD